MKRYGSELHTLKCALADEAAALSRTVLGMENQRMSQAGQLRFGAKGSLLVNLTGPRRGHYYDFENDQHGDLLDLIQHSKNLEFRDAVSFARQWLGLQQNGQRLSMPIPIVRREISCEPVGNGEVARNQLNRDWKISKASEIWQASVPIAGTRAEYYLNDRTGGPIPSPVLEAGNIRFHGFPVAYGNKIPGVAGGMVARMVDPLTGDFCGIQSTFFSTGGSKITRHNYGSSGVVRLYDPEALYEPLTGIGLAEGIETALTVAVRYQWKPLWASLSAGMMKVFPVLPFVDAITLFADNDKSTTGQKAAIACARRWEDEGRETTIYMPPGKGQDFNDLAKVRV